MLFIDRKIGREIIGENVGKIGWKKLIVGCLFIIWLLVIPMWCVLLDFECGRKDFGAKSEAFVCMALKIKLPPFFGRIKIN